MCPRVCLLAPTNVGLEWKVSRSIGRYKILFSVWLGERGEKKNDRILQVVIGIWPGQGKEVLKFLQVFS